jgi:hypothetical protein
LLTITSSTAKIYALKVQAGMTHRSKLVKPENVDLKAHFEQTYKQAIYEVYNGQKTIQIQIGKFCPPLDSLIIQDNCPQGLPESFGLVMPAAAPQAQVRRASHSFTDRQSWALITASNPYSQILAELENQQRHQKLKEHLQELQYPWLEALGRDQTGTWTPEPSFWILGIERSQAIAIGRQFEQNAIVYGELHQPAELQWL